MNQHQSSPHGLEPLLNIDELADYLGVPVSTIYDWRTKRQRPPSLPLRQAHHVRYHRHPRLDGHHA